MDKIPFTLINKANDYLKDMEGAPGFPPLENLVVSFDSELEMIKAYDRDSDILVCYFPY